MKPFFKYSMATDSFARGDPGKPWHSGWIWRGDAVGASLLLCSALHFLRRISLRSKAACALHFLEQQEGTHVHPHVWFVLPSSKKEVLLQAFSGKKPWDLGAGCLRFKKIEDIPLEALGKIIGSISVDDFIESYKACIPEKKRKKWTNVTSRPLTLLGWFHSSAWPLLAIRISWMSQNRNAACLGSVSDQIRDCCVYIWK